MGFIKIILLTYSLFARTALLELATKQKSTNINYFFKNNDSSFYVKGGKTLAFSTKYKSTDIIKIDEPAEFRIDSFDNQNFLILARALHHSVHIPVADHQVYLFDAKNSKLEKLGHATYARFINNGKFIALFSRFKNTLSILKFSDLNKSFDIKLSSPSKYFIPEVEMTSNLAIYYTDLNNEKITGLMRTKFQTKKKEVLLKATNSSTRLELCQMNNETYILDSAPYNSAYTQLYSINDKLTDISKRDLIFTSTSGPASNLICSQKDSSLYFVKNMDSISGKISEAVSIDTNKKKAFIRSDLRFTTNLIEMDGDIYIFYRQKLYAIKNAKNEFIIEKEIKDNIEK